MRGDVSMQNGMSELSELFRTLKLPVSQQQQQQQKHREGNMEALMRLNCLGTSLDQYTVPAPDTPCKGTIDTMLELMNGTAAAPLRGQTAAKSFNGGPKTTGCEDDTGVSLRRLLAQSYNYSSESSGSPNSPMTQGSATQVGEHNNSVFSFMDDSSPQSNGSSNSRHSFTYSQSPANDGYRIRASTSSESGSPTLEEAILMGCQSPSNPLGHDVNANKVMDATLASLVNSLNLGGGNRVPASQTGLLSSDGMSRSNSVVSNGALLNTPSPHSSLLGLQHLQQLQNMKTLPPTHTTGTPYTQLPPGLDLSGLAQLQNVRLASQRLPGVTDGVGTNPTDTLASLLTSQSYPYCIEKAAKLHRTAAAVCDAACTWSGQLPSKVHKNPIYSCKVFLGGVPWDVSEPALKQTFSTFGDIQVEWPYKKNASLPKGYLYIIFEDEKQVKALLAACSQDFSIGGNYYYKISSRRIRQKEVQVIPWIISDSNYVRSPSYQLDPAKTVFVGALHGMLSAEGLANIMNDLFGGVVYSGIDTDKNKYPIGSGRVTFNNDHSYRKAVRAGFVEIKTPKFTKKVQIDPYLADSFCQLCGMQKGPYFCRNEGCFKYYCAACWVFTHPMESHEGHKPIMRNCKLRAQTNFGTVI